MKMKLTARTVAGLKPMTGPYEVRDTDIIGFLLRVQPSGQMTYYLDYRTPEGRRNRFKIGPGGKDNLSPEQARSVAKDKNGHVAHGTDIQADKVRKKREAGLNKRRTLGAFLEEVYSPWATENQSSTTGTAKKVKAAFPHLLTKSMLDITPWLLESWRTDRRKAGKAPSTINRDMTALKGVLTKAVEWDYVPHHPLPRGKVKQLTTDDRGKVRYLSAAEETRLRAALDDRERALRTERASANSWRKERGYDPLPDLWTMPFTDYLKPMVLLALNTGMRRGELFKLTWDNVDANARTITVTGVTAKSKKTRHIPLNKEAIDILKNWRKQGDDGGLVFPSAVGTVLDNIQTSWGNLTKKAKLKAFRFHDLRHSFASRLVMAGVDLNTVRELLGHSDIKMTLRYAHLAPEHKAEAVSRLMDYR